MGWSFASVRVAAGCAILLGVASGCDQTLAYAVPDDPEGWSGEGRVVRHADVALAPDARRDVARALAGAVYFTAVHVGPGGELYVFARSWNDLQAAVEVTRAQCRESVSQECVLYATVVPKELEPSAQRASGLGVQSRARFRHLYARAQRAGSWGAFAVSSMASSGISARRPSRADAIAAALSECRAYVAQELVRLNAAGRRVAVGRGYSDCRVIHVTEP